MTWGEEIISKREKIQRVSDAQYVKSSIKRLKGKKLLKYYNNKLKAIWKQCYRVESKNPINHRQNLKERYKIACKALK